MISQVFSAYSEYKDSGIDWLGKIPTHWNIQKIKYNSYVKGRIGWQNLRSEEFTDEGAYLITGMHFKDGSVDWDSCYHITQERYEIAPEIQVKEHDVLMTKDGSIGKLAYIDYLPKEASLNSHLLVIRPLANKYHPKYLYYLLYSSVFKVYVLNTQTGTTFFGITQESVVNFPVILPSINEQKQIVTFLDRATTEIDQIIEQQKQLITLLEEERTTVISHAVTKGLDPSVPMKDSGIEWLGEIPKHWDVKKLKYIAYEPFQYGANEVAEFTDTSQPRFIRITDINDDGSLRDDTFKSLPEDIAKPFLLKHGDILFARSGATVGKTFMYRETLGIACYAGYLVRLRVNPIIVVPEFIYLFTSSLAYWSWLSSSFIQATIQNVSAEKYANLVVSVPPLEEQNIIIKYLNSETARIDEAIDNVRSQIEKLEEYRTVLISDTVTGKIDVRGFEQNV
ncbi:restriction endonuclease subunit S [Pseudanabaena sp. 'Roaring Creek']|uniref:restriction endonuclease subunit S n=1 Tax=Pseudanabaena sp. 'Roaring Creek' TaxID=1681830 RepID=UPI0006D7EF3F|nr:restriction endonuclease subunit S [Pseudanabaena sp. 'Roaring Creek']